MCVVCHSGLWMTHRVMIRHKCLQSLAQLLFCWLSHKTSLFMIPCMKCDLGGLKTSFAALLWGLIRLQRPTNQKQRELRFSESAQVSPPLPLQGLISAPSLCPNYLNVRPLSSPGTPLDFCLLGLGGGGVSQRRQASTKQ